MFKKNLNTILSSFTKLQTDLKNFIEQSEQEGISICMQIDDLTTKQMAIDNDITKAEKVLENINNIINPPQELNKPYTTGYTTISPE